jgi:hypothetical protein
MHGGNSLAVVELGERRQRGVPRCLEFPDWGLGRRMVRGMSDMGRKYPIPVGYSDELKKLFVMIATII